VVTGLSFSEGTHLYSVDNYSETFDPGMIGSPVRVELNLNGAVSIYSPPAGEGSFTMWNVFNLIVDSAGNITVETVGTWE